MRTTAPGQDDERHHAPSQAQAKVLLRHTDSGLQLVSNDVITEDVPARAAQRSRLLQTFADAARAETWLDVSIVDMREWIQVADGMIVGDQRILEALNVRQLPPY